MDIITSRVEWCEFRCTNKWLTLDLHSYSSQSMAGWLLCGSHTSLARCRPPKFACDWPAGERRERDLHLHSTHVTLLCVATLQGLTSNAPPSLKVKGFNSSQEFKMKRNCLGGSKELSYFWDSNKKKNSVALCDRRKKSKGFSRPVTFILVTSAFFVHNKTAKKNYTSLLFPLKLLASQM